MKHGSSASLWSQIASQLSGQQQVKTVQSNQRHKHQQASFRLPYFGMCIISSFEARNRLITATNEEEKRQCTVTSWLQWWQNYMNCISNCFRTHPICQIWPPVTIGCLQTSKKCSRQRDLAPMKKWYWKLRFILRLKTNRSTKKTLNCYRSVGISVSP